MKRFLRSAGAQVAAEVTTRLRSASTPVALLLLLAGSILWIPDPRGRASSLSWTLPDGRVQGPEYSAAYVGFAAAVLVSSFVPLIGFYLVAGSVRRDRERGVGAILAATPLTKAEYLVGKFAAHAAYLGVVMGLALVAALVAWVRFGRGPFSAVRFFVPFLVLGLPAVVITAALAVLFDVAPVLSSRTGLVLWFFAFLLMLVALPMMLSGEAADGQPQRWPALDPAGAATEARLARQSVPGATSFATGLLIRDASFERVPWAGIAVTPLLVATRAANLLAALPPLALAILVFDRFDPARGRRPRRRAGWLARFAARPEQRDREDSVEQKPEVRPPRLSPVELEPSARLAILAEARLLWDTASWIKWPLLVSSCAAALLPGEGFRAASAVFFLLLVPAVSEAAAREELAGTRSLVFAQPGVPASPVLWKVAAVAVFLLALGAPALARALLLSPARGAEFLFGLLFVSGVAASLGSLTGGGKLFSGAYLALWYVAVSDLPAADFAGALSKGPALSVSAAYLGVAGVLIAGALLKERVARR